MERVLSEHSQRPYRRWLHKPEGDIQGQGRAMGVLLRATDPGDIHEEDLRLVRQAQE